MEGGISYQLERRLDWDVTDLEKDVVRSLVQRGVGVGVSPPLIAVSLGAGRSWHGDRVVSEGSV